MGKQAFALEQISEHSVLTPYQISKESFSSTSVAMEKSIR